MAAQIVVALFQSKGIAEDACHRLRTEGVPDSEVALKVLKKVGPVPETMEPELSALSIDPMIFGDVRNNYVQYIHNGETAVLVRAATDADVEFAADVLRLFEPIAVDVLKPRGEGQTAPAARSRATSSGE